MATPPPGLLHVRPVLDLHHAGDLQKIRQLSDEVSALVRQFKGSLAGEHGVGIARTEYVPDQIGPELDATHAGDQSRRSIPKIFSIPAKSFPTAATRLTPISAWAAAITHWNCRSSRMLAFAAQG